MKRNIVKIHEELCNGCEKCVSACHEGAIQMVDGVAKLVSDIYCDGLGDCLQGCPTGAIEIIEREADEYSQDAVDKRLAALGRPNPFLNENKSSGDSHKNGHCDCPGHAQKTLKSDNANIMTQVPAQNNGMEILSELRQWPIQLMLVNPGAPYLKDADILIAADCTAYAFGDFHRKFMKGKVTLIGCPKLDDNYLNVQKITEILMANDIKSITVVRMEVPCCGGIVAAAQTAIQNSGKIVPYVEVTVSSDGKIVR